MNKTSLAWTELHYFGPHLFLLNIFSIFLVVNTDDHNVSYTERLNVSGIAKS